jgi:hypothetical protein
MFTRQGGVPQNAVVPTMQEDMKMKHTLRELLGMGSMSVQCSFTSTTDTATVTGDTYVSGGKVRTDTVTTDSKDASKSVASMIIDGDYLYAWGGELPHGMKMKLTSAAEVKADVQEGKDTMGMGPQASSLDEAQDYTCKAWNGDASYFALPAGITFTDYSEMMQGMSGMNGMGDMMQNALEGAPGGTDAGMMDGEMMMDHSSPMGAPSGGTAPPKAMLCAACEQAPDAASKADCRAVLACE